MNGRPQFSRPGISPALLEKAGVRHVSADEARALVGYSQAGLLVPYVTRTGDPVKIDGVPFARLRVSNPTSSAKYLSPIGSGCQLYEPPDLRALLVPGCLLGVVEYHICIVLFGQSLAGDRVARSH